MKRAVAIGIDNYSTVPPLSGCVHDAIAVSELLAADGDGAPNFSVKTLTSDQLQVSGSRIQDAIEELFSGGDAETVVLYFAGHGIIFPETNSGYIVAQDGRKSSWGMSLSDILALANGAYPKIRSSVIILDCCHSGALGEVQVGAAGNSSVIGTGVTILTASHRNGMAAEGLQHGLFTDILLDGLKGGCADVRGNITPAALYSHVDQTLGPWEQRPIYKANVQNFVTLRRVQPKITDDVLRRLLQYFPDPSCTYPLDPSYEPDRENIPVDLRSIPVNSEHVRVFKELQQFNRFGLVVPIDAEHMYYAAIRSTGCRLTAIGAHYRKLAETKRI